MINLFVRKTAWERLALSLVHIFLPIILQKPEARDHARYLTTRLKRWADGDLDSLMAETREIQQRMNSKKSAKKSARKEETREKAFLRLMMFAKIGPAAKYVNNDDNIKGVHPLTNEIKEILQSKHPAGQEADPNVMYECTVDPPQPVIYEAFTADQVQRIAKNMNGSGGPTLLDSDTWKDILCSKVFGTNSILSNHMRVHF